MLSQAEIDALLSGAIEVDQPDGQGSVNLAELMGDGGADGAAPQPKKESSTETKAEIRSDTKVQAYNFWSPDRFSKEQMRAVELVHEDLAERLTNSLPSLLRTNLHPRLVHSEQGRFHDFLNDSPPNTLFHLISLAPLPGQIVLTISPNVSHMVLEQRLGGKTDSEVKERPLTDIDQSLLRGLVEYMLNDVKSSWSRVANLEPSLDDSTTNMHWVQMVMGNERVMLLTFEVTIQGVTGTMNMYIPFSTLKPISSFLNPHVWISGRKERQIDPAVRQVALDSLSQVNLPVQVELGRAVLPLSDIVTLEIGDIIPLETSITADLPMKIAKQELFMVQVGRSGNRLAVQVKSHIHEEA
jgi:flagellar motor switch protein FliM